MKRINDKPIIKVLISTISQGPKRVFIQQFWNQKGKFHVHFYAFATEWVTDTSDCQNVEKPSKTSKQDGMVAAFPVSRDY